MEETIRYLKRKESCVKRGSGQTKEGHHKFKKRENAIIGSVKVLNLIKLQQISVYLGNPEARDHNSWRPRHYTLNYVYQYQMSRRLVCFIDQYGTAHGSHADNALGLQPQLPGSSYEDRVSRSPTQVSHPKTSQQTNKPRVDNLLGILLKSKEPC